MSFSKSLYLLLKFLIKCHLIDIHHKGIDFIAEVQKQLNCFQMPASEMCLCENRKGLLQGICIYEIHDTSNILAEKVDSGTRVIVF